MRMIEKDFEATKELVMQPWKQTDEYTKYREIFLYGTENQEELAEILDYKDKTVFTAASSGESYLTAIYNDAAQVDIYDINRLQFPVVYLKIASMMALDYKEFFAFLTPVKNEKMLDSFLNPSLYDKVVPYLPLEFAWYWAETIALCAKHGFGTYFLANSYVWESIKLIKRGIPFYKNKEAYYKLQAMLKEKGFPNYYELDMLDANMEHSKKYDILYLSNIINHNMAILTQKNLDMGIFRGTKEAEAVAQKEVLRKILPNIYSLLKEDGTVLVGYRANRGIGLSSDFFYHNPIFDVHTIPSKFPPNYENWKETDTDLVLTYTPKNGRIDHYLK